MFLLIAILLRFLQAKSFVVKKTANRPFTFKRNLWYDSSSSSKRRQVIAGNWKCNPSTYPEAKALLKLLTTNVKSMGSSAPDIIIFPPAPFLSSALTLTEGSGIQIGAQDVSLVTGGAFTGETSASMLRTLGCDFVLVGHSERRTLYDESDATINSKVKLCLAQQGLKVILCVGETLDEFQQELLENVVSLQVKKGLAGVSAGDCERIVIAYEPVWAIGTGEVATPEQAQNAHVVARHALFDLHGERTSREVRILYGGSVNPETIDRLMGMPDVDGGLVGGASLSAESFSRICSFTHPQNELETPKPKPREFTAKICVACANALGESPVWSERDQTLYWVSAVEGELWRWNLNDSPHKIIPRFGTTLGFVALRKGGGLLLGGEDAILTMSENDREATVLRCPAR